MRHASDCAIHSAPAYAPGPCDCGLDLALDPAAHRPVSTLIIAPGRGGSLNGNVSGEPLVKPHKLPPNGLVVDAAAS